MTTTIQNLCFSSSPTTMNVPFETFQICNIFLILSLEYVKYSTMYHIHPNTLGSEHLSSHLTWVKLEPIWHFTSTLVVTSHKQHIFCVCVSSVSLHCAC